MKIKAKPFWKSETFVKRFGGEENVQIGDRRDVNELVNNGGGFNKKVSGGDGMLHLQEFVRGGKTVHCAKKTKKDK